MELTYAPAHSSSLRMRGTVRVAGQFTIGLLALAAVGLARATIGRSQWGTAVLVRFGAGLAGLAGPVAAVLTALRTRRSVPAYRDATAGRRPWRQAAESG